MIVLTSTRVGIWMHEDDEDTLQFKLSCLCTVIIVLTTPVLTRGRFLVKSYLSSFKTT